MATARRLTPINRCRKHAHVPNRCVNTQVKTEHYRRELSKSESGQEGSRPVLRRGIVPAVNPAQAVGALFIGALTLSLWESPGFFLTAFTLGQFAVMLSFVWVFTHRFGTSACLRHLFIGVSLLALATVATLFSRQNSWLVIGHDTGLVIGQTRVVW